MSQSVDFATHDATLWKCALPCSSLSCPAHHNLPQNQHTTPHNNTFHYSTPHASAPLALLTTFTSVTELAKQRQKWNNYGKLAEKLYIYEHSGAKWGTVEQSACHISYLCHHQGVQKAQISLSPRIKSPKALTAIGSAKVPGFPCLTVKKSCETNLTSEKVEAQAA